MNPHGVLSYFCLVSIGDLIRAVLGATRLPGERHLFGIDGLTRIDGTSQLERSNAPRTNAANKKMSAPAVTTEVRLRTESGDSARESTWKGNLRRKCRKRIRNFDPERLMA
jgi:hypothetical protein